MPARVRLHKVRSGGTLRAEIGQRSNVRARRDV
jgi:hypothetical protein